MQHEALPIGSKAPDEVNMIVEVPKGSYNKYKYAPSSDVFRFDRTLFSPLHYPSDYGWICGTKGAGRKPLNILVMSTNPTFVGCLIVARPIGALLMNDGKGEDHKVLSVAVADPRFVDIKSLKDISDHTLTEIRHFFEMYQVLEQGEVEIIGWEDAVDTRYRIATAAGLYADSDMS
jgi:inorganic pyrophosphatase